MFCLEIGFIYIARPAVQAHRNSPHVRLPSAVATGVGHQAVLYSLEKDPR